MKKFYGKTWNVHKWTYVIVVNHKLYCFNYYNIIISNWQGCESDLHPFSPKTQAPQYKPIERKKNESRQKKTKKKRVN